MVSILLLLAGALLIVFLGCITFSYDLLFRAKSGDAEAQYQVGLCYDEGNGVTQDYNEAIRWYRLSAEQGGWYALNNLGLCYFNGQGVNQNYQEAVRLFRLGAEAGSPDAMCNLGRCYYFGTGITQDYSEAYFWTYLASLVGHHNAVAVLSSIENMLDYFTIRSTKERAIIWAQVKMSQYVDK